MASGLSVTAIIGVVYHPPAVVERVQRVDRGASGIVTNPAGNTGYVRRMFDILPAQS
jgi:hypothetical protein